VIRLFRRRGKGHEPDIEALSAHLDGRLDARRAAALEAHVAACEACRTAMDGLRESMALLRRMPVAEAPRSFRLRPEDVAATAQHERRTPSLVRWSPVAAGAAIAVFAAVLGTDLATRGDGGSPLTSSATEQRTGVLTQNDTFEREGTEYGGAPGPETGGPGGAMEAPDTGTSIAAAAPPLTASTEAPFDAVATPDGTPAPTEPAGAGAAAKPPQPDNRPAPTGPPPDGDGNVPAPDAPAPREGGPAPTAAAGGDAAVRGEAGSTPTPELSALASEGKGGEGNRTGFLIVEIAAGVAAVVSGGTFAAWRLRRRGP
jgi:hypothetical protein